MESRFLALYQLSCASCQIYNDNICKLWYDENLQLYEFFIRFKSLYSLNVRNKMKVIEIQIYDKNFKEYYSEKRINGIDFKYQHDKNYLLNTIKTILLFS